MEQGVTERTEDAVDKSLLFPLLPPVRKCDSPSLTDIGWFDFYAADELNRCMAQSPQGAGL